MTPSSSLRPQGTTVKARLRLVADVAMAVNHASSFSDVIKLHLAAKGGDKLACDILASVSDAQLVAEVRNRPNLVALLDEGNNFSSRRTDSPYTTHSALNLRFLVSNLC